MVLASAFGWAVPMAYVASMGDVDTWGWLVFFAYMCWTVAYDTMYAMCDRDDDKNIGVKSTAILFGRYDVVIIMALQACFIGLMGLILWHYFYGALGPLPIIGLLPVALMVAHQYQLIKGKERLNCFNAFLHNAWVGRYVLVLVLACAWGALG